MDIPNLDSFKKAVFVCVTTATLVITFSLLGEKNDLFLLLNADLGYPADVFFHYATFLGDGIMWVPFSLFVLKYRRKFFPLLLSTILISTILVQSSKHYIFPDESRPTQAISNMSLIHTVEGVELHKSNSFPSGHNTTIFSIYLIACLLTSASYFWLAGFFGALIVGYSRIYLAQHFPIDAGAGIFTAVLSVYIAVNIQRRIQKD